MIKLKQVIHYPDTNSVEATWVDEEGIQARCHSYADVQMDMLRADLDTDVAEYEELIALVESNIQPAIVIPVVVPPIPVTPWQIRKALNATGLRESVETAVAAADTTTQDAWQYATSFVRTDPLVVTLGSTLGKTEAELDALFELAVTL